MKKLLFLILMICTLLFSLTACTGSTENVSQTKAPDDVISMSEKEIADEKSTEVSDSGSTEKSVEATAETPLEESTESPTETTAEESAETPAEAATEEEPKETASETTSKSLVVYFSWSGNTENVAKSIQTQTNSNLFEIVPKTPYSDDYNTVVDLAQEEQKNNARPEIADVVENIDQYDMIYIGFPNWWGDMPMILYTFFDTYDLSGKTIAPFCTSGGSGLSNTVNEMKELEPNAMVTDGLHIGSEASSSPDDAVSQWLNEIGVAE